MALSAKLVMRQGQSLVMTPQLLQAIKLLQFSNIELASFIEEELERNPMLERIEESGELPISQAAEPAEAAPSTSANPTRTSRARATGRARRWRQTGPLSKRASGPRLGNTYDSDRPCRCRRTAAPRWRTPVYPPRPGPAGAARRAMAKRRTSKPTSRRNRRCTIISPASSRLPAPIRSIASSATASSMRSTRPAIVREAVADIARPLGTPAERVEAVLAKIQTFDPVGRRRPRSRGMFGNPAARARSLRSGDAGARCQPAAACQARIPDAAAAMRGR